MINIFYPITRFSSLLYCENCFSYGRPQENNEVIIYNIYDCRFYISLIKNIIKEYKPTRGITPHLIQIKKESLEGGSVVFYTREKAMTIENLKTIRFESLCTICGCGIDYAGGKKGNKFTFKAFRDNELSLKNFMLNHYSKIIQLG